MRVGFTVLGIAFLCLASAASGQVCDSEVTVGNFDVVAETPDFDGSSTEFSYCITGLDDPALSNWMLSLDGDCLNERDVVACSPETCFFQEDDPNLGLSGMKWEDTAVEPGEEVCFSFSLAGDWTGLVGPVSMGIKAGQNIDFGTICGPICVRCASALEVSVADGTPSMVATVLHNRPRTITTDVVFKLYQLRKRSKTLIHEWDDPSVQMRLGEEYSVSGAIPGAPELEPGRYLLKMSLRGMNGRASQSTVFEIE